MPATFNVTLVIEDLELNDDNLDRLFDALPDAVPAEIAGLVTVESPVDADTAEGAAFALIETIVDLFPDAQPCRLDQDLVSIPDVARRTDRSRESVRLLVDGKRGPGSFPTPAGTVGDGVRVWPWAVVVQWFAELLGEEIDDPGIPPQVAAVVDACLAARRVAVTLDRPHDVAARFAAEAQRRGVSVGQLLASLPESFPASADRASTGRRLGFVGLGASTAGRRARDAEDLLARGFGQD